MSGRPGLSGNSKSAACTKSTGLGGCWRLYSSPRALAVACSITSLRYVERRAAGDL